MITKNRGQFKLKLSDLFPIQDRLLHLIFPATCIACKAELSASDTPLCPFCINDLDYTHFEKYTESTTLEKLFWGRVPIEQAYAHLFYRKGGSTQQILQELKYKFNAELGRNFGNSIGNILREKKEWMDVEYEVWCKKETFNNVFTIKITNPYLYVVPFPVKPIIIKTIENMYKYVKISC